MPETSNLFQMALGLSEFNPRQAINLYTKEIKNNAANHAAFFNRGICKIRIAEKESELVILNSGRRDIIKADKMANEECGHGYESTEVNLKWADEIEEKFKQWNS